MVNNKPLLIKRRPLRVALPLTSLASNEDIEKHHEIWRMDVDFESCKVRVERERWIDSQGDPHEWLSLVSEPISHMASTIDEFRRQNEVNAIFNKPFGLHCQHLEGVVRALHVASQKNNCLRSEIVLWFDLGTLLFLLFLENPKIRQTSSAQDL